MAVKLVTDSSSDIPPDIAGELDITVVPLYVRFGDQIYRDGLDISADEFYDRLVHDRTRAQTSTPSPSDYTQYFQQIGSYSRRHRLGPPVATVQQCPECRDAGRGIYRRKMRDRGHRFRISLLGCGLAVIAAAHAARARVSMEQVTGTVRETLSRTHIAVMISDINYLLDGRRLALPGSHVLLGKLGTIFRLKLVGEIYEARRVWGRGMYFSEEKALARLEKCVTDLPEVEEIAVMHAMQPEWAHAIAERLGRAFPRANTYVSRLSGATGVHSGPKAVRIAFTASKVKSPP